MTGRRARPCPFVIERIPAARAGRGVRVRTRRAKVVAAPLENMRAGATATEIWEKPMSDVKKTPSDAPPARPAATHRSVWDRALRELPVRSVAVCGLLAGGVAFLVAVGALIAALMTAGSVEAELTSLRESLTGRASRRAEVGGPTTGSGGVFKRVDDIAEQVSRLESAVSGEQARRVEELERALAAARAALPGGRPPEPDPRLAELMDAMAKVAALPSVPETSSRSLLKTRKSCEGKQKSNLAYYAGQCKKMVRECEQMQREADRDTGKRREEARAAARKEILKVIEYVYSKARDAERKRDWQGALTRYRDLAGLEFKFAAKTAAEGRKKVLEVQAKLETELRERKEQKAREGQKEGKHKKHPKAGLPEPGGHGAGVEVF